MYESPTSEAKPASKSKTVWVNAVIFVLSVTLILVESIQAGTLDPTVIGLFDDPKLWALVLSVVNLALRYVTKQPITLRVQPDRGSPTSLG